MGGERIRMAFRDSSYVATTDANGRATISVAAHQAPWYAVLHRPYGVDYFYITPQEPQTMTLNAERQWLFDGGAKAVNEYLNSRVLNQIGVDYALTEAAFLGEWQRLYGRLLAYMNATTLPADFKSIERIRLYYASCNALIAYPLHHTRIAGNEQYRPGSRFYAILDSAMVENATANGLWEYRQAFRDYLKLLAERHSEAENTPLDKLKYQVSYIRKNIKDAALADYLLPTCLLNHIRQYGTEGTDETISAYLALSRNSSHKRDFVRDYERYAPLAVGKQAPNFVMKDVNGTPRSLSELRGKYVYIDVWATWCMPCLKEIPHLKALEQQFAGKPIAFVSISIDKDEAAWKAKVVQEQMTGIQLHAEKGSSFQRDYNVSLLPHFILIDPQGRFVKTKMTRPSDKTTSDLLRSLLEKVE